jgi:hypothetical protein
MAKGFDLLIEFLLDEIALQGELGEFATASSFLSWGVNFYVRRMVVLTRYIYRNCHL